MKQQSNELDLSLFFSNIYRFFYKNSRLLLTFILLGAVLGFVYDTISKPYYESTAYATSALSYFETEEVDYKSKKIILDQQAMVDIINDISRLVDEDEMDVVARKLNLSAEATNSIRFLEAEELFFVDGENIQQKRDKFQIVLEVYDNQYIRDVEKGIEYFVNNNSYIQKYYQLHLDQSNQLVERISKEIDDLKRVRDQAGNKSSGDYSEIKMSGQYSQTDNQIINLFIKQQQIAKYTLLLKPIEFFEKFAVPEKPANRVWIRIGLMTVIFFMFGIIVGLIRFYNKRMKAEK
jgi:hypothetical protein